MGMEHGYTYLVRLARCRLVGVHVVLDGQAVVRHRLECQLVKDRRVHVETEIHNGLKREA